MIIQFVLPFLTLTGGVRLVFEQARGLRARGHQVRLLVPHPQPPAWTPGATWLRGWKHFLRERWDARIVEGARRYELLDSVVRFDPRRLEDVPNGDAAVATAWETAEWLHHMPGDVGRKHYYLLGYEVWNEAIRPRVEATWKLPLRKIAVAHWLAQVAREKYGQKVLAIVPSGVDLDRFRPDAALRGSRPTVGMLYDPSPWKGAADGIEAMRQVIAQEPDVGLQLFGRSRRRHELPRGARWLGGLSEEALPSAYQTSDVFLCPSYSEGFSLLTLEAMACGAALVATEVGEVPFMGRPGTEYLMVPPADPAALSSAVLKLLRDPELRRSVSSAGQQLAGSYTWERSVSLMEQVLCQVRDDDGGTATTNIP